MNIKYFIVDFFVFLMYSVKYRGGFFGGDCGVFLIFRYKNLYCIL